MSCSCSPRRSTVFASSAFAAAATTAVYTLSLHDALPICRRRHRPRGLGLSGRGRIGDAMDFGIFLEEMRRGISQVAAFHEGFQLVDAAEAWGVDGVWLGEMHFNPDRSVLSASIAMASSIATRTRRLRVGTA